MFCVYRNGRLLAVCLLTLAAICAVHRIKTREPVEPEPFGGSDNSSSIYSDNDTPHIDVFQLPTPANPFSNVLPTDYDDSENKKPAAPASNAITNSYILGSVMDQTDAEHVSYPNMSTDLILSDFDKLAFEQSMRPFYSTASTTIPNDQSAFADFCYGTMLSCRDNNGYMKPCGPDTGTPSCNNDNDGFACARNAARYNLY